MAKKKKTELRNPKRKEENIGILQQGIDDPFWQLICEGLQEGIAEIKTVLDDPDDEIRNLPAEKYKFTVESLKDKESVLELLKDLPELIMASLQGGEGTSINFDPYESE